MIYNLDFHYLITIIAVMLVPGAIIGALVSFISHIVKFAIKAVTKGRVDL